MEFRILGPLKVFAGGREVPLGGVKPRALLAYLLLNCGETVSRERLVDELWGEQPPKAVAAELRVYVAKLRKALGPEPLLTRRAGYELVVDPDRIDIDRFERGARYGAAMLAAGDAAAAAAVLASALALWRGPLLADLAGEEWVQSEARRAEELRLVALEERVAADLALGRHIDQVAELATLAEKHPYRERFHGQLMLALYRSGRQAEALGAYRAVRALLREGLGLDPGLELQRLERKILTHDPDLELEGRHADGARVPAVPAAPHGARLFEPADPGPFVGRENSLAFLLDRFGRASGGRSEIVFIKGEAGSGKTALLAEFARRAEHAASRLLVVAGQCRAATGAADAFAPFRRVMGMLVGDLHEALATGTHGLDQGRRLWAASPDALAVMLEHAPNLVETVVPAFEVVARARASAPELARRVEEAVAIGARAGSEEALPAGRIRDECLLVLDRVSRRRPLLLLLDDLQWADPLTLDLLAELVDHRAGACLIVAAAFRTEDVADGGGNDVAGLVHLASRHRGDVVLDIDQAAAAEARVFVDALIDREPNRIGDHLRSELTERSGGHALFAVELVRELKASGSLQRDEAGRWRDAANVAWDRWPARIEGLLAEKFSRIDLPTLDSLRIGSVEGEEFTADVVATVLGVGVDDAVDRLSGDATARHHVVRAIGTQRIAGRRVLRYRFRHGLYQRFLYEHLDEVQRPYLHERVASALEALCPDGSDILDLALAHHLESAGLAERAVPYLHRSGLRAIRLSANESAVAQFAHALALLSELPRTPERDGTEAELQLQLAVALAASRGFGAPEVEDAYARATERIHATAPKREQLPMLFGLWLLHSAQGDFDRSSGTVRRMFEISSAANDDALTLQALHASWAEAFTRGQIDDAVAAAEKGLAIYRPDAHHEMAFRYGNHDPGVCGLAGLALALAARGDGRRARDRADEAIRLSDALEHSFTRAHAESLAAWALQISGDAEAALRQADRALAFEAEVDAPYFFSLARNARGWALSSYGHHEEGAAELEHALATQLQGVARVYAAVTAAYLVEAYIGCDRPESARPVLEEMRTLSARIGPYFGTPELRRVEARWLALEGRDKNARQLLLDAVALACAQGSWALALRAGLALVGSSSAEADFKLLADLCDRFPTHADSPDLREARTLLRAVLVAT